MVNGVILVRNAHLVDEKLYDYIPRHREIARSLASAV